MKRTDWTHLSVGCALAVLTACGGGRRPEPEEEDPGPTEEIGLSFGTETATEVNARTLTLEIRGETLTEVSATVDGTEGSIPAVPFADAFYVFHVPLLPGPNVVTLAGTFESGNVLERTVDIVNASDPAHPVDFDASPRLLEGPGPVALSVFLDAAAGEGEAILVDQDGDGIPEQELPFSESVTVDYGQLNRPVKPTLTVRTTEGLLFTTIERRSPSIATLPPLVPDADLAIAGVGTAATDIEWSVDGTELHVLDADAGLIRRFDINGEALAPIDLLGASAPRGFCLDADGNVFVADTGAHRVVKFVRANGFNLDFLMPDNGGFGTEGSGPGELSSPEDVEVLGTGNEQIIYVADTGNGRIQRFNRAGVFELAIAGDENAGEAFQAPAGLEASGGGMHCVDVATSQVSFLTRDGFRLSAFGGDGDGLGQLRGASKVSVAEGNDLVVADSANRRVQLFTSAGALERVISTGEVEPVAASVRSFPDGRRLYVIGSGRDTVDVFRLDADPLGNVPLDVVRRFLDAVVAQDAAGARAEVSPDELEVLELLVADATAFAEAAATLGRVSDLAVATQTENHCIVSGIDSGAEPDAEASPVEFHLSRSPITDLWQLARY